MKDKNEIITLYDDKENEYKFKVFNTFGVDEKDYAVLKNIDEKDENIYFFEILTQKDGNFNFLTIDDEDELNDIVQCYLELTEEDEDI